MEDGYMEQQDVSLNEVSRSDAPEAEAGKDFAEYTGYEEGYEEEDGGNNFRGNRGRGSFRWEIYVKCSIPMTYKQHTANMYLSL